MKRLLFLALPVLPLLPAAACGPDFPDTYLNGDIEPSMPHGLYSRHHLKLLGRHFFPEFADLQLENRKIGNVEAFRLDLAAAGRKAGWTEETIRQETENFLIYYKQMSRGSEDAPASGGSPDFPEELREFYLYARGVGELKRGEKHTAAAVAAWEELLKLQRERRLYCTSRALFMLGNLKVRSNPDEAFRFYQRLRRELAAGCLDTAGLNAASFVTLTRTGALDDKLRYLLLAHTALKDFRPKYDIPDFVRRARPHEIIRHPVSREVAFLARPDKFSPPDGHERFLTADRMAHLAFDRGDFEACRKYLGKAPEDSLIALWLNARLARREGDNAAAAQYLRRWLSLYDAKKAEFSLREKDREVIAGELGCVEVERQDFAEALYAFLQSDSEWDARAVADRYMTEEELEKFLAVHPAPVLRRPLGRRLLRRGLVERALPYFPEWLRPLAERYGELSVRGNDVSLGAEERALALYNLGKLQRFAGMELLGYEYEPDFALVDGQYVLSPARAKEEKMLRRFHYRGRAVGSFARAANLSQNPVLKAAALIQAADTVRTSPGYFPEDEAMFYRQLCDLRPLPVAEAAFAAHRLDRNFKIFRTMGRVSGGDAEKLLAACAPESVESLRELLQPLPVLAETAEHDDK